MKMICWYLVTDHSIDRALRIEQYSTWHVARVSSVARGGGAGGARAPPIGL